MESIMKFYEQKFKRSKLVILCFFISKILLIPQICEAQNLLSGPQKIVIDSKHNRYLVSNFNGNIVQIDSAGNQSIFKWNAEFNDGMEIVGNTVYGTFYSPGNPGQVKGYDLDTRQPVMEVHVNYVTHLSSITADSSGNLYLSASFGTKIVKMRLSDLAHWLFVDGQGLNNPNGMIYEEANNRLVVCEDRPNPSIKAVSLVDSAVTTLTTTNLAGSDGIAKDVNGIYYLTGYFLNGIYMFDSAFSQPPEIIYYGSGIVFPTYDEKDHALLITKFNTNTWEKIPLPVSSVYNTTNRPKEFILYQNYPNPFNPSTTIGYLIPHRGHITLKIYDTLGNEIATLINEENSVGEYEIEFDGKELKSGIYFYQFRAGSFVDTKKMVLMK
jgi:hypothetical protein